MSFPLKSLLGFQILISSLSIPFDTTLFFFPYGTFHYLKLYFIYLFIIGLSLQLNLQHIKIGAMFTSIFPEPGTVPES